MEITTPAWCGCGSLDRFERDPSTLIPRASRLSEIQQNCQFKDVQRGVAVDPSASLRAGPSALILPPPLLAARGPSTGARDVGWRAHVYEIKRRKNDPSASK